METKKLEYIQEIKVRLGDLESQLEGLMAQATQSDYDEYLTDIRDKQESAQARLVDLEEAGGYEWQNVRAQLDKAVREVQNALFVVAGDYG